MSLYGVIHAARGIVNSPMLRPARLRWEEKQFLGPGNLGAYFGVYGTFGEARARLPQNPGFDTAALAPEYVNVRTQRVFEYDYPMIRWLERAFQAGATSVLDIGGSVGVHFYSYGKYLKMPAALNWRVVEVPEMVSIGQALATKSGAVALSFSTDLAEAMSSARREIWISAGAIQYFEDAHPARLLEQCRTRPTHILLNKLPLYDGEDFVTTQSIGEGSFSPVHVYNKTDFIRSIERMGYVLCDGWDVHERAMHIPCDPEHSFSAFSGLYFLRHSRGGDSNENRWAARPATTFPTSL